MRDGIAQKLWIVSADDPAPLRTWTGEWRCLRMQHGLDIAGIITDCKPICDSAEL
jgi:hypothetical protein